MNQSAMRISMLLAGSCLFAPCAATYANPAIDAFKSPYYTDVFDAVAQQVAYEPYAGVQRGAAGAARSHSANALDQALLLSAALEGAVFARRVAQGRLRDPELLQLLGQTSSSFEGALSLDNPSVYDPINDPAVQRIAREHAWVEVQLEEGSDWLALDPVFPGALPGESFASPTRTFEAPAGRLHQRMTITLMQTTSNGRRQKLGRIQGTVAELAMAPVSLVVRAIPQFQSNDGASNDNGLRQQDRGLLDGNPGGLLGGGGLGGRTTARPAPEPQSERPLDAAGARRVVATEYRREVSYAGRAPETMGTTRVEKDDPDGALMREWLDIELVVPGQPKRRIERDLFRADSGDDVPADVRRYSIAVVAGAVTPASFEAQRAKLDAADVQRVRAALDSLAPEDDVNALAMRLMQFEAGQALTPHLINLAFASESDTMSERLAQAAGVRIVRDVPRILITSMETRAAADGEVDTQLALDLRLDEVTALPHEGMPRGAAALFQRARGMQESALEGRVLARFSAEPDAVVTTTRVMSVAQRQGHELVALSAPEQDLTARLKGITPEAAERIEATLLAGHQVIAPSQAARIGGRSVWGWWDVDPATGAFVGVLESGQHQAMVQYTVTLEKVGVNDAMGYAIGALTGSTATMTLYSAKMLEYGQVTPELIAEVAAGIERLTCVTCPSFEVVVSPLAASASFESTCYEQTGVSIGTGGGVSGSISFCENYKLGISCAASLMLGTFNVEGDVSIGPNLALDLGPLSCD